MQQIKSRERVSKYGEVFTNEREVKAMCDLIPPDVWENIESSFFEPCCGEGVFILEILKRKFSHCRTKKDYTTALQSVYGMDIQADNAEKCISNIVDLCKVTFPITKAQIEIINNHIVQADSLKIIDMMATINNMGAVNINFINKETSK